MTCTSTIAVNMQTCSVFFYACSTPIGDCEEGNASVYPGAFELCDGVDTDCNGLVDGSGEADTDGDGAMGCDLDGDSVIDDCDDANAARFVGNPEVCDGVR